LSSITCAQLADMLEKPFDQYEPRWLDGIRSVIHASHIGILKKIPNDAPGLARSWVTTVGNYIRDYERLEALKKVEDFLLTNKVKLSAVVGRPTEKGGYPKYTKELADFMKSKGHDLQHIDGVAFLFEPKPKKSE